MKFSWPISRSESASKLNGSKGLKKKGFHSQNIYLREKHRYLKKDVLISIIYAFLGEVGGISQVNLPYCMGGGWVSLKKFADV